jgi:alpha-D-ribose 1-methylphosphonate 5-triphosphate synthase subunit PhnG
LAEEIGRQLAGDGRPGAAYTRLDDARGGHRPRDEGSTMDRNRRFEVLAQAEAEPLLTLAEAVLAAAPVAVVTPPRVGMIMLRARDSVQGEVFNAGEVLVTEAHVALGEHRGYAMRLGRAPEATLAAAVLDVAVEAGHALAPRIEAELAVQEERERERQRLAWQAVAPTRVAFDEMT